jgi:hypothetical protein
MIDIAKDMQCTQYKLHGLQNKYKKCIILLLHVPLPKDKYIQLTLTGGFLGLLCEHCFICRLKDSTVSEDAGIEPGLLRLRR